MTTDMTTTEVNAWSRLIRKVAYQTARDFPDCDIEELTSCMWTALLELRKKGKLLSIDDSHAESSLRYAAKFAAWKERRDHLILSVQYAYRTSDVRKLFDYYYDREMWSDAPIPEDAKTTQWVRVTPSSPQSPGLQDVYAGSTVANSNDCVPSFTRPMEDVEAPLEVMSDISRAYDKLDRSYKVVLFKHHVQREPLEPSEKKRLSKAYARMADILNTYQPSRR